MESKSDQTPVIAIVGETASGKSALAIELAQQFNGEIIAADSRTIYWGMDIGTAKPTPEEQAAVPHHLIDVVNPDQPFSVVDFTHQVKKALSDISSRHKVPFLVGGSGLYIDAVLYDFSFRDTDPVLQAELKELTVEQLQKRLSEEGIPVPENKQNPRHLIRALESKGQSATKHALRPNTIIIGLQMDRKELYRRITARIERMIADGFIEEASSLAKKYGWDAPGLQSPGYREFRRYIQNDIALEEAKILFVRSHIQLAKRQRTWFKRNKDIHWICKKEEAVDLVTTLLNK